MKNGSLEDSLISLTGQENSPIAAIFTLLLLREFVVFHAQSTSLMGKFRAMRIGTNPILEVKCTNRLEQEGSPNGSRNAAKILKSTQSRSNGSVLI